MAKQNFISGGYYGKLGATVGQRWKNKRTIRTYVKPANPRTAKQQANRHLFGGFTENAQVGMSMNYKAPCWDLTKNTEWALRMSTASELYKNGATGFNLIPLFPTTYSPKYSITEIEYLYTDENNLSWFAVDGTIPDNARYISVLVGEYNEETQTYSKHLIQSNFENIGFGVIYIRGLNENEKKDTSKFFLVSYDDAGNNDTTIYGAEQNIVVKERTQNTFNTSVKSVSVSDVTFDSSTNEYSMSIEIIFNTSYFDFTKAGGEAVINCVYAGVKGDIFFYGLTFENSDGDFKATLKLSSEIPQNMPAFDGSGTIRFNNLIIFNDSELYINDDTESSFSATATERQYLSKIKNVETNENNIEVVLEGSEWGTVTPSGTITFYAQQDSSFVTKELTVTEVSFDRLICEQPSGESALVFASGSTAAITCNIIGDGVTYTPTITIAQTIPNA